LFPQQRAEPSSSTAQAERVLDDSDTAEELAVEPSSPATSTGIGLPPLTPFPSAPSDPSFPQHFTAPLPTIAHEKSDPAATVGSGTLHRPVPASLIAATRNAYVVLADSPVTANSVAVEGVCTAGVHVELPTARYSTV
jgi:hypothetical protein